MEAVMSEDWRDKYFDDKFANIAGNFKQVRSELKGYKQETTGRLNDLSHKVDVLSEDKHGKKPVDAKSISIAVGTAIGTAAAIVLAAYEIYSQVVGS